ncbi:prolyl oligopeptidase family serine peptidase [Aerosakkonemataceae cyanobacterium BLCC-F154]|uniref:Prolyl oligopeptidase family serine peptidase n=1 Tax=Floridaenema fluviatile BLCC-F154 TaxID=3153640 RepID=A0ABV4Y6Y3_9CYAN
MQQEVSGNRTYNYLLFLPKGYETKEKWPLILFLHGAGERGDNLNFLKRHGVSRVVEEQADFPFIVVSPQCTHRQYWSVPLLLRLLDEAIANFKVDPERIYLTGLSMGGYGTWHLAAAHPHLFAAIAPICGGGDVDAAFNLKNLPVWAFHGAKDRVVPISESEEMVKAVKKIGGNIKFTVYPETEHDSWTETYNNPELYEWFLAHQRTSLVH